MKTYRKIGGGSFLFKGKRIKRNQTFKAEPHELPKGAKDVIVDISGEPEQEAEVEKAEYELSHRSGPWYDVLDAEGKKLNEKSLSRVKALELIKSLE